MVEGTLQKHGLTPTDDEKRGMRERCALGDTKSALELVAVYARFKAAEARPAIAVMKVSKARIPAGDSTNVTWRVINADTILFGEPDPRDERSLLRAKIVQPEGSLELHPPQTTTYVLHAENRAQEVVRERFTIEVIHPIDLDFRVGPARICARDPDQVALRWRTTSATRVTIDGRAVATSGEERVRARGPAGSVIKYRIVANNPFESVETTREVHVMNCRGSFVPREG